MFKWLKRLFMSKIDRLDNIQKILERKLENKKSSIAYVNSKIEAKVIKLQEKAFHNRVDLEKFESEVNLKLDKNEAIIQAEADYVKELSNKYIRRNKKVK